jgi:PAS domain S-box-containing protein
VLLFAAVVLITHGVRELGDRSTAGLVLAWAGFAAFPLLAGVGLRLARDVHAARDREAAARAREDAARAGEAEKARLLDCAESTGQELIWEITPDGVVTYMSGVARSMFGIDPAALLGESVLVLVPDEKQAAAREMIATYVRERAGWTNRVLEMRHVDGGTQLVESSGVVRLDAVGDVVGFTATTRRLGDESVRRIARDKLRSRILGVIETEAIRTFFQPIVDLRTGTVLGHEALSRFAADPAQPPDRWFADAEEVGLGTQLDLYAIQTALTAAHALPSGGYVSINAAPATVASNQFLPTLIQPRIPLHRIVVELTEHVSVQDYPALDAALAALRRRGVRLAIDDAGSGYASFRHILRLRPDIIKLDRDIVRDLDRDQARAALVTAMVGFAHAVGAVVTAEGVETAAEQDAATRLGIDAAQGYLFAAPARYDDRTPVSRN